MITAVAHQTSSRTASLFGIRGGRRSCALADYGQRGVIVRVSERVVVRVDGGKRLVGTMRRRRDLGARLWSFGTFLGGRRVWDEDSRGRRLNATGRRSRLHIGLRHSLGKLAHIFAKGVKKPFSRRSEGSKTSTD
jgi:hypothetical protein